MSHSNIRQYLRGIPGRITQILGRIIQILALIYVYIPVFWGILYPMAFLIPVFYISRIGMANIGNWLGVYYLISPDVGLFLVVIEMVIFCAGCSLFLVALGQLTQGKKQGEKLVQRGLYRYVRHPQHLGISIMALPFAFYIPWGTDFGIRMGDLMSWIIFTLLLAIYSDIEEYRLKKLLPEEFPAYQATTGFFFPRIGLLEQFSTVKRIKESYVLKYTILLVAFFIFSEVFRVLVKTLEIARFLIGFR